MAKTSITQGTAPKQSNPNGRDATRRNITGRTTFCDLGAGRGALFEVRHGVESGEALEIASNYLASALGLLDQMGKDLGEDLDDRVWAPFYIVEQAKAIVDAVSLDGFEGVQS